MLPETKVSGRLCSENIMKNINIYGFCYIFSCTWHGLTM